MNTQYIEMTKSQKALQDIIEMSKAITDGEQVKFASLPDSQEKRDLFSVCVKFNASVGQYDKLTTVAMSKAVKSAYERTVKGDSKKASSKYEKEVASLRASLLLGESASDLIKKQDDRNNSALYRKNLLMTDKSLQAIINAE